MYTPRVSIQIPCYNADKFVEKAIKTSLAQSYSNLKIYILDDASNDNTIDICKKFSYPNLTIIQNNSNLGRVLNYQNAFLYSKESEWFANLDGDDYYINNQWIEEGIEAIGSANSSNIVLYQGSINKIEKLIPKNKEQIDSNHFVVSGYDYICHCIENYAFFHLSCLFKTEIAETIAPYSDNNIYSDFFTAMRIAAKGNVIVSNKNIGIWSKHSSNASNKKETNIEQQNIQKSFYLFFQFLEDYFEGNQINSIIALYEKRIEQEKVVRAFHNDSTFNFIQFMLNNPKLLKNYWKWIIKKFICIKK